MQRIDELVSIIIPVYQTKQYLRKCIESVMKQDYSKLEIILVDDGSTDGSEKICDEYAAIDSRIKVLHGKNRGLSYARNVGIDIAQGEYISFVDSDDILHPHFISYLFMLCKKNNADIAQCDFLSVRGEEDVLPPQKVEHIQVLESKELMSKIYTGFESVKYVVVWNKLYKREIFRNVRFPVGKIHEDEYVIHKLFWNARNVVVSNLYMYYYVQRTDSIVGKKFSIVRLDGLEALRLRCEFFLENNLQQDYYRMTMQYYRTLWKNYYLVKDNIEESGEILDCIECEANKIKDEILASEQGVLLEKLRAIYPYVCEDEKLLYKSIYGERITYEKQSLFRFPFGIIEKNSKIAMFGASEVGKAYYEQIKDGTYCNLVLWVDNLWKNHVSEGYNVQPVKKLLEMKFDVVLLAVQRKSTAEEITENLVSWGVDREKIWWELPDDTSETRVQLMNYSNEICLSDKRKVILLNTADHGNLGDQILAENAIRFMQHYFKEYEIIEISGRQWDETKELLKPKISSEDVLFFVGGGYMGNLWPIESKRIKEMIESLPDNKKVFLPQSFFYSMQNAVQQDKSFFERYHNIIYIHREECSYKIFSENVVSGEVNRLFPDMALFVDRGRSLHKRDGIIGCFRLDKEKSSGDISKTIYDYCCKKDITYKAIDTLVYRNVTRKNRKQEIDTLLKEFSEAKLVITDRLHGMLFCAITGTPCLAMDNISRKVSGVYRWIECLDYIKIVDSEEDIEKDIELFLEKNSCSFSENCCKAEFERMAFEIRKWCEL